ncbi:MAG: ABC transporter ATP-binding protein [Ignavibacteria bacterium]|nr:ABC transporter ATP-binding protein [Ignavibacteria bacterium]
MHTIAWSLCDADTNIEGQNVLNARQINVWIEDTKGREELLHEISFCVNPAETVMLLGESGSGKTTLVRALTYLFPTGSGMRVEGTVTVKGIDVLPGKREQLSTEKRKLIRYIFQEPSSSLNPVLRIKSQFQLLQSFKKSKSEESGGFSLDAIQDYFVMVGIQEPERVLHSYPHELSLGTLQRILIVMALIEEPPILIADEPISAVDASLRYQILDLLSTHCRSHGMGLLVTTHDLRIAQTYADRIIVLYAGRIIESAPNHEFFSNPYHPYSKRLLASMPARDATLESFSVTSGSVQAAPQSITGCKFHPHCPQVKSDCSIEEPALLEIGREREVRCLYWK